MSASKSNIRKTQFLSNIITLDKNDVKSGAGNHSHPGNKYYTQLIDVNKKAFVLANSRRRTSIVNQIYTQIRQLDPPGRFLKKGADGRWCVQDKDTALKKVRTALCENSSLMKENLKKTGEWSKEPSKKKSYPQRQNPPKRQEYSSKFDLLIQASLRISTNKGSN